MRVLRTLRAIPPHLNANCIGGIRSESILVLKSGYKTVNNCRIFKVK